MLKLFFHYIRNISESLCLKNYCVISFFQKLFNFSLGWTVESTFPSQDIIIFHRLLFLYILPNHQMNWNDWKMLICWCRTDICSCKLSAKVSFMLDTPFLVPPFCKLNHISVYFIQIITKSGWNLLIPFRESSAFFEVIPGVLGRSVNLNIA